MACKIIEQKERNVIGIEITCPFERMEEEIPKAWQTMKNRIGEVTGRMNETTLFGMYPQESDNPDPNKCYYYIGVEVASDQQVPQEMVKLTIPAQKYVSFLYRGPINQFFTAYEKVNAYMDAEGCEHDRKAFVLELKGPNSNLLDKETPNNELELCLPIK